MSWPVESDEPDAARTGDGDAWIPSNHQSVMADTDIERVIEPVELVQVFHLRTTDTDGKKGWQVVYLDTPETLAPKLALADERGLAGVGFWAIGYDRGSPEYGRLIKRFKAGKLQ